MEELIFLKCYKSATLLKLNFFTSFFIKLFIRDFSTLPFQSYLISILFNYISVILDFRKTETRKVLFWK